MKKNILSGLAFCGLFTAALLADGIMGAAAPIEPVEEETAEAVIVETPAPVRSVEEASDPENDYSWIPLADDLAEQLVESCEEYEVPLELALAVMEQESGFQTDALNEATGCYGLMQINPSYFPSGLSPAENINAGVEYLGELMEMYGDKGHAATAYFYGPTDQAESWYSSEVMEKAEKWEAFC